MGFGGINFQRIDVAGNEKKEDIISLCDRGYKCNYKYFPHQSLIPK